MKKSTSFLKVVFGLLLILVGVLWFLNVLGIFTFDFSLKGWWAFFVIIPCAVGFFTDTDKVGSLMGVCLGVLLFLAGHGNIEWNEFWKLGLATIIVFIGIKLIVSKNFNPENTSIGSISREGRNIRQIEASFGRQELCFDGIDFEGADIKCSFGSVTIDLRKANILSGASIDIDAGFGGVLIILPDSAVVKTSVNAGFGGLSDERRFKPQEGEPVVFITGKIGFAGVELKN